MTQEWQNREKWKENVILVDADYVDKVLFNLTVNFERMLERHIPKAELALWADCTKQKECFELFDPSNFAEELTGKAFKDHIGEFAFDAYPAEEDLVEYGDFFAQALQLIASQEEVKRLMVIPNAEDDYIYNKVRETLNHLDDTDKRIMVYAMQPMPGGKFQQEILGYSLMAALRIKPEEIKNKIK